MSGLLQIHTKLGMLSLHNRRQLCIIIPVGHGFLSIYLFSFIALASCYLSLGQIHLIKNVCSLDALALSWEQTDMREVKLMFHFASPLSFVKTLRKTQRPRLLVCALQKRGCLKTK